MLKLRERETKFVMFFNELLELMLGFASNHLNCIVQIGKKKLKFSRYLHKLPSRLSCLASALARISRDLMKGNPTKEEEIINSCLDSIAENEIYKITVKDFEQREKQIKIIFYFLW